MTYQEVRSTCRQCGQRSVTRVARRSGGGSYRRASRAYRTRICQACASRLLARATTYSVDRWDVISLERAWGEQP